MVGELIEKLMTAENSKKLIYPIIEEILRPHMYFFTLVFSLLLIMNIVSTAAIFILIQKL
jgi:hypothetical protein